MASESSNDSEHLRVFFADLVKLINRHFTVDKERAEWLADRLMSHGILNGYQYNAFDRPKDIAALERVDKALLEIQRATSEAALTDAAQQQLLAAILTGPFDKEPDEVRQEYMKTIGRENFAHLHSLLYDISTFRDAVRRAIETIRTDSKAKRSLRLVNAEGIGLVQGCRYVWFEATGKIGPYRDLNPASKFAAFLGDAMNVCEIRGDPRSAFLAWTRIRD